MQDHRLTEAPRTHIKSEVVAARTGFKIIRLQLPTGEQLPTHSASKDVAIIVIAGTGRVSVDGTSHVASPGVVMNIPYGAKHGVAADEALEILVVQAS